jgi:predicted nuclease with TOPRIM domain
MSPESLLAIEEDFSVMNPCTQELIDEIKRCWQEIERLKGKAELAWDSAIDHHEAEVADLKEENARLKDNVAMLNTCIDALRDKLTSEICKCIST